MDLERLDRIWWHEPSPPWTVHHGWVESLDDRGGIGCAEVGVATRIVPPIYIHAETDQPPVPGCSFCQAGSK